MYLRLYGLRSWENKWGPFKVKRYLEGIPVQGDLKIKLLCVFYKRNTKRVWGLGGSCHLTLGSIRNWVTIFLRHVYIPRLKVKRPLFSSVIVKRRCVMYQLQWFLRFTRSLLPHPPTPLLVVLGIYLLTGFINSLSVIPLVT